MKNSVDYEWDAVSQRFRQCLKMFEVSVPEAAKMAGVANRTAYKVYNGEVTSPGSIALLATALHIDPDWLAKGTGNAPDFEKMLKSFEEAPAILKERQAEYRARKNIEKTKDIMLPERRKLTFGELVDEIALHFNWTPSMVIKGLNKLICDIEKEK